MNVDVLITSYSRLIHDSNIFKCFEVESWTQIKFYFNWAPIVPVFLTVTHTYSNMNRNHKWHLLYLREWFNFWNSYVITRYHSRRLKIYRRKFMIFWFIVVGLLEIIIIYQKKRIIFQDTVDLIFVQLSGTTVNNSRTDSLSRKWEIQKQ